MLIAVTSYHKHQAILKTTPVVTKTKRTCQYCILQLHYLTYNWKYYMHDGRQFSKHPQRGVGHIPPCISCCPAGYTTPINYNFGLFSNICQEYIQWTRYFFPQREDRRGWRHTSNTLASSDGNCIRHWRWLLLLLLLLLSVITALRVLVD